MQLPWPKEPRGDPEHRYGNVLNLYIEFKFSLNLERGEKKDQDSMALKIEIGGHGRTLPPTSSPLDWDDWYQGFWDGSTGVDLNSYLVTFFVLELQHPQKLGLGMFRNGFL